MNDTTPVSRRPGRGPWYCGACNGPLWRPEGCRLCRLDALTSVEVLELSETGEDFHQDPFFDSTMPLYVAKSFIERWAARNRALSRDACNDTNGTEATSWWLPPGAVRRAGLWDRHRVRAKDDRSYAVWLSVHAIPPRDLDLIRAALTDI